jgi:hypothetical protein
LRILNNVLLVVMVWMAGQIFLPIASFAQQARVAGAAKTKIILDTDIGDDIDDVFALALALRSPEVEIVGISTAWGDTELRAQLVQRFLKETGSTGIPNALGITTKSSNFRKLVGPEMARQLRRRSTRWIFCWSRRERLPAKSRWWRLVR